MKYPRNQHRLLDLIDSVVDHVGEDVQDGGADILIADGGRLGVLLDEAYSFADLGGE